MNRQSLSAIRRVLRREKKQHKEDDLFTRPGQHPGMGCHLVSDGQITILLDSPLKNVPVGSCMDSLAGTIYKECNRGGHLPLEDSEIKPELWDRLRDAKKDYDVGYAELKACTEDGDVISGWFSPLCLMDALEAVGEDACFYLGYGGMGQKRLTVLIAPPEGSKSKGALLARVRELKN